MKKAIFILTFLLCIQMEGQATETWRLSGKETGRNLFYDALETEQGDFLLVGTSNFVRARLIKIDRFGKIKLTKTYFWGAQDIIHGIIPTLDGGYLVTGSATPEQLDSLNGDTLAYALVAKLNSNYDVVWSKRYLMGSWGCWFDKAVPLGKGFCVTGFLQKSSNVNSSSNCDQLTMYINENGDSIATTRIKTGATSPLWVPHETFHLSGISKGELIISGQSPAFTAFYDTTGKFIRQTIYTSFHHDSGFVKEMKGVVSLKDKNIDAGCTLWEIPSNENFGLMKLDSTGKLLSIINLKNGSEGAKDFIKTADNKLLFAGDFSLLKTDTNGKVFWRKLYPISDTVYSTLEKVIQCKDSGFLMIGYSYTLHNLDERKTNYYVVKTDKDGYAKEEPTTTINTRAENHFEIKLYPNPVKGLLNIETNFLGNASLILSDLTGRKVLFSEVYFSGDQLSLPIHLSPGIYMLEVKDLSFPQTAVVKKLVVE